MKACTRSRVEATLYLGATRSEDCILPISQSDLREPLHLPAAQKVGGGRLNHRVLKMRVGSHFPHPAFLWPWPGSGWKTVEAPRLGAAEGGGRTVKEAQWWVLPGKEQLIKGQVR